MRPFKRREALAVRRGGVITTQVKLGGLKVISSLDAIVSPDVEGMLRFTREKHLTDGLVIALLRGGEAYVRIAGEGVKLDSCFEISSITKIYTAELLNQLVDRGLLGWDDTLREHLPAGLRTNPEPAGAEQITLLDIAEHKSGLPLLPPNLKFVDGRNPFGYYTTGELESYLAQADLRRPQNPVFSYSNTGYAVLGYVAERVTGRSYRELLEEQVLMPAGLDCTRLALVHEPLPEVVQGHSQSGREAARWRQEALAPAGGLCSTAKDQLSWIQCLLDRAESQAEFQAEFQSEFQAGEPELAGGRAHGVANGVANGAANGAEQDAEAGSWMGSWPSRGLAVSRWYERRFLELRGDQL